MDGCYHVPRGNVFRGNYECIISPTENDVMRKLGDLRERNFTPYISTVLNLGLLNSTTQSMQSSSSVRDNLEYFLQNMAFDTSWSHLENSIFGHQGFSIDWRESVLEGLHKSHELFKSLQQPGCNGRRCHVGQELLRFDEEFFVTLPPRNGELSVIQMKLL